jgi:3-isopropylmalate/(R)-2-methylmalate dehydratase small subunit
MQVVSRVVPLPNENVDTDQIIPARFLKTVGKEGLGQVLLYDWRYDPEGNPVPDFILNRPEVKGAEILLAGDNFGCGSSREHAPWALAGFGFRVLISTSFADIFKSNCIKNGILPVTVGKEVHSRLFRLAASQPDARVRVDLEAQTLYLQDGQSCRFPLDPFAKRCFLEGIDELSYLLGHRDRIAAFEAAQERL